MMRFGGLTARGAVVATALIAFGPVAPASAAQWVYGYYGPAGAWHPGHWAGGIGGPPPEAIEAPSGYGPGRVWVHGYYGPAGGWHPGHWAR